MAERAAATAAKTEDRRFLAFRLGDRRFALAAEHVAEVIRVPTVAKVPQAPKSLLGVGNLRGSVLPVASLRALLGLADQADRLTTRAIVLGGSAPIAIVVDRVESLLEVAAAAVETDRAALAAEGEEPLVGVFHLAGGDVVRVLDLQPLLTAAFARRARPPERASESSIAEPRPPDAAEDRQMLVTFDVAGQDFALDLSAVREIRPTPAGLTVLPQSDPTVLGVALYRDRVLPLLSLRGLLGFDADLNADDRRKMLVTTVAGVEVGLVADRARSVLAVDPDLLEPVPRALAARAGGETRIRSIYRGGADGRLISVLATERLFREDVMRTLRDERGEPGSTAPGLEAADSEVQQFLIFRLGEDEYALPISAVLEVARVPDKITRVPKTPKFLEGVVNLRGDVIPVVDQRRRFDLPPAAEVQNRRMIVIRPHGHPAGLIVDAVSEVLRTPKDALQPPPALTEEMSRLVQAVIALNGGARLVLVLDPSELLSQAEQGLLDRFQPALRQMRD